jgi:hypothetical protein
MQYTKQRMLHSACSRFVLLSWVLRKSPVMTTAQCTSTRQQAAPSLACADRVCINYYMNEHHLPSLMLITSCSFSAIVSRFFMRYAEQYDCMRTAKLPNRIETCLAAIRPPHHYQCAMRYGQSLAGSQLSYQDALLMVSSM